jgi:hypothetical protein
MLPFKIKPIFFYSHTNVGSYGYDTRFMSNLYPSKIILNDKMKQYWNKGAKCPDTLPSTEHGYQAFKPYENDIHAYFILGIPCTNINCRECEIGLKPLSSNDAAKFGQGRFMANRSQTKWLLHHKSSSISKSKPKLSGSGIKWLQNNCIDLMMDLLRCKFTKDNDMGKLLLEFSDQIDEILFTEHTKNDKIWADAKDGSGTNYLGKLLTIRLRELIDGKNIEKLDYNYLNKPNIECVLYT